MDVFNQCLISIAYFLAYLHVPPLPSRTGNTTSPQQCIHDFSTCSGIHVYVTWQQESLFLTYSITSASTTQRIICFSSVFRMNLFLFMPRHVPLTRMSQKDVGS